jgi:DTW domain-containing protein YfiP
MNSPITYDDSKSDDGSDDMSDGGNKFLTLEQHASHCIAQKSKKISDLHRCPKCFLSLIYCICTNVRNIVNNSPSPSLVSEDQRVIHRNINFHVFMHFKEWGRASNTGKLLPICLPEKASIEIYGIQEDCDKLAKTLQEKPSLILYPTADAKPISEYRNWVKEHNGDVHICVIDSTWIQSHAMEKSLPPEVPRVKIDEMIFGPSKFLNRKQSKNKSKVSTIESVIMALRALGLHDEELDPLEKSFEYGVDAMLRQGGKPTAFGNFIKPMTQREDGGTVRGPYTAPRIVKPQRCLRCGISGESINFKNVGVRRKTHVNEEDHDGNCAPTKSASHQPFTSEFSEEYTNIMSEIMSKKIYRVWRCPSCQNYFPGEEDVIVVNKS